MMRNPSEPSPSRAAKAVLAGLLVVLLAACGTTDTDDGAVDGTEAATEADEQTTGSEAGTESEGAVATTDDGCTDEVATSTGPVTLTDDFGRTIELERPAQRVAALEWQQVEDVLTLCIEPVAVADVEGYGTWVSAVPLPEGVVDVGNRGEPNVDALGGAEPDLIIVEATAVDDPLIGQLEGLGVPVLATKGADATDPVQHMLDTLSLIAEATGRTERAETVIAEFEAGLEDGKEALAAAELEGNDFVYLDGWIQGGNVSLRPFGQGSLVGEIGEELGLTNAWTGEVDEAYGLGQTDIEGMADVEVTWILHTGYDGPDPEAEDAIAALEQNPIWTSLPAVSEGRLRSFPPGIWTFGGPRSTQQVIDAYLDVLGG